MDKKEKPAARAFLGCLRFVAANRRQQSKYEFNATLTPCGSSGNRAGSRSNQPMQTPSSSDSRRSCAYREAMAWVLLKVARPQQWCSCRRASTTCEIVVFRFSAYRKARTALTECGTAAW